MDNARIADLLAETADLLEFTGANAFRVRAYRNAEKLVRELPQQIASLLDEGQDLTELAGIGDDLADKLGTLSAVGTMPMLEQLRKEIPAGVLGLLRIPGLGPKKAATLFKELGITSLDALNVACQEHRVQKLKGFGAKTEATIAAGILIARQHSERLLWAEADRVVAALVQHLDGRVTQVLPAGSYRRGKDTVGDLDLVCTADDPQAVMDHFGQFDPAAAVVARGPTKMSVRLSSGLQADLRVVPAESYGAALQYFTGSKEHNVVVRGLAKDRGLKINEYGVFRVGADGADGERIAGSTEEEVYAAVGLPWFPPELREARREFVWAAAGALPKLVEIADIRGDLHMHTTASDGEETIEAMAAAAKARGLTYIAITDHSQRSTVANGLGPERLLAQWKEVDAVNARLDGIRILKGVEVDILERGGLDLPDEVLAQADWVMASVHYGQNQPRQQITDRITGAVANRFVSAVAHPTGRLLNRRPSYEVDLDAVFQAAKEHGKAVELNANPRRLDLDDAACAAAVQRGLPVVISTDAHSIRGLDVLRYGILQARRGGLTAENVLNTRTWEDVQRLIRRG